MEAAKEEKSVEGISTSVQSLFSQRIDFHPARKPYTGVPLSSGDFRLEILNPSSAAEGRVASVSGVETSTAEMGKKSTFGEFHEHGLDSELSFRISFQRIGAGLENLGNTCYLNSVLQCLTYTEPFAAYLQSGKHKSTCRAAGFCAMCALQNHVMDALQSTGKILRPFHLVRNLRCISRSFRNSRQEDAHEYMVNLLESMHKCCLPSGVPSESPSAYEKSLVHKIFGGQLRSQVKCMQCSYSSDKFDPFLDLSLEIVNADSLKKAFLHFTAMEQLDNGEKQYQCLRCKEKVQAYKQLTIHKAPHVLSIHLKRFGSSINGEKISKKVEFEPTLNLKPFFSGAHEEELKYTLYGVLVHAGWSTHSGHYFCYVRTSAGLWYSLDDNHVSQVSEKVVLSREAYMLFYVRDTTSAMKQVQVNLNANISASSTGNKEASLVERKLNNAVFNSTKAINDAIIHDLCVPVLSNTRQHLFKNQQPLVQYDDNTSTKDSYLQINGVPSNGLHKAVLPTKKTELKSQLPSQSKIENVKQSSLEYATEQKIESNCAPSGNDDIRSLSQSNAISGPIKEAKSAKFMEYQANDPYIKDFSIYLQNHEDRENLPNFLAAKPSESLNPNKEISTLREGTSAVSEIGNFLNGDIHQTRVMPKKRKAHLLAENSYNWRKQLFFMSLRLHNKTKKKKTKRHSQNLRNNAKKKIDVWTADSEGTSTSETFRTCAVDSTSRKKCKREKVANASNDYSQMSDKESNGSCMTGHKPGTLKRTRSLECTEEQQNVKIQNVEDEEKLLQNCPARFLKESLRETTVARWDAEELATQPRNDSEDTSKRTIGYLLDEWDEEYDRGKRKKLKSRQWSNGQTNPFQETANFKAQQRMMKVVQTSFGKEPFRI